MPRRLRFAAIADDYTGGSDLTSMLAAEGVRAIQFFGLPRPDALAAAGGEYDAAVVCLKSRSIEPEEACRLSVEALERVAQLDPLQWQFKYCSTFDSTDRGNIGPVASKLMERLGVPFTTAIPALPVNGRTQYGGYLFVNGALLSESPMRDHPLNPMREPSLVRHLQRQTSRRVGLIGWEAVRRGPEAIRRAMKEEAAAGVEIALVDALTEDDLDRIAEAVCEERLLTGGSGITAGLARFWRRIGLEPFGDQPRLGRTEPGVLVIAGSCSAATLRQLEAFAGAGVPVSRLDVAALMRDPEAEIARLEAEVRERRVAAAASSMGPAERRRLLEELEGRGHPAEEVRMTIEAALAELARRIVSSHGIARVVVAGGETAGAVIEALGAQAVEALDTLDPGVPALMTVGEPRLALVLKSGNFGRDGFFPNAVRYLEGL